MPEKRALFPKGCGVSAVALRYFASMNRATRRISEKNRAAAKRRHNRSNRLSHLRSKPQSIGNGSARFAASSSAKRIFVELATPRGRVFFGTASAVEFSPANGVVQMERGTTTYFTPIDAGEITLRLGKRFRFFTISHGSVSMQQRRLTVIAEIIQPIAAPVRNCANRDCTCGDDYAFAASINPPARPKDG